MEKNLNPDKKIDMKIAGDKRKKIKKILNYITQTPSAQMKSAPVISSVPSLSPPLMLQKKIYHF